MASPEEKRIARGRCTRSLSRHGIRSMRAEMQRLAALAPDAPPDEYGAGAPVQALEQEVAQLLGKESAVFLAKGVIAQLAALRVWSERSGRRGVVLHPRSHIDLDEAAALERLHSLTPIRCGADDAPLRPGDLAAIHEPVAAVVVELPLRRAGFLLPSWEDLVEIGAWARARGAAFHIDGARLWEAQPFYDRPLAQIAGLADSVYVSFYKGLGGLAGCVLAGASSFIAATAVWRHRHGAPMFSTYPLALAAHDGLRRHLPRMPAYRARAQRIARVLGALDGLRVNPQPPHSNAFQLLMPGEAAALEQRALEIAASSGVWLFDRIVPTGVPGLAMGEVQIGDGADALGDDEIQALIARLVAPR